MEEGETRVHVRILPGIGNAVPKRREWKDPATGIERGIKRRAELNGGRKAYFFVPNFIGRGRYAVIPGGPAANELAVFGKQGETTRHGVTSVGQWGASGFESRLPFHCYPVFCYPVFRTFDTDQNSSINADTRRPGLTDWLTDLSGEALQIMAVCCLYR